MNDNQNAGSLSVPQKQGSQEEIANSEMGKIVVKEADLNFPGRSPLQMEPISRATNEPCAEVSTNVRRLTAGDLALQRQAMSFEEKSQKRQKDHSAALAIVSQLRERCAVAKIPFEIITLTGMPSPSDDGFAKVSFPNGRDSRPRVFSGLKEFTALNSCEFEKCVFLGAYEAICSYTKGFIEAAIRFELGSSVKNFLAEISADRKRFSVSQGALEISLSTEPQTKEYKGVVPAGLGTSLSHTLLISGLKLSQHDEALSTLERISTSLFFEIDMSFSIPISLRRRRISNHRIRSQSRETIPNPKFPGFEYDAAPMSLYWYARNAIGMPLLQFLAYYQVLEFYFPTYANAEAKRRVLAILKRPNFRLDREADVGALVSAANLSSGFGDERSQLRSVLNATIDPNQLRQFLTSDSAFAESFTKKGQGPSSKMLNISNDVADLRNDVADRLYDLRCRIVHTKAHASDHDVELMLPYSKDAERLRSDIRLMRYLAQQVLSFSSLPVDFAASSVAALPS